MEQATTQAVRTGRDLRRTRTGVVVSDVRDKTITVLVEFEIEHSRYGKRMRRRSRFQAHDPKNEAKVGDQVLIMECRPVSKTKSWRLEKVLHRSEKGAV